MTNSPLTVARADELVEILRKTDQPLAYKLAYNELLKITQPWVKNDFFPVSADAAASSLRGTLGACVSNPSAQVLRLGQT